MLLVYHGKAECGVISALVGTLYVACLFVPAQLQSNDLVVSKLVRASVLGPPYDYEIAILSSAWTVELFIVLLSEILALIIYRIMRESKALSRVYNSDLLSLIVSKRASLILITVGIFANIVFPAGSIEDRGAESGQGVFVILKNCLVIGLAVLSFYKFFDSKKLIFVAFMGVCFLISGNVRSPLLVVLLGYAAGVIARKEIKVSSLFGFAFLGVVLAVAGAFMSAYRGEMIKGRIPDPVIVLNETMSNPFVAAYQSGVDTLDGYRLSAKVQPGEPSDPKNLLVAFTTFIPRAVWPNKPTDLSIRISARYLHYGAGGAFLSPIGYLRLAMGGYIRAVAVWGIIIFILSSVYIRQYRTIIGLFIINMTFRLTLAGSPFDIYYTLTLALVYALAFYAAGNYTKIRAPKIQRRMSLSKNDGMDE